MFFCAAWGSGLCKACSVSRLGLRVVGVLLSHWLHGLTQRAFRIWGSWVSWASLGVDRDFRVEVFAHLSTSKVTRIRGRHQIQI